MKKRENAILFLLLICSTHLFAQSIDSTVCIKGYNTLYSLDVVEQAKETIDSIEKLIPDLYKNECWEIYVDCYNSLAAAYYYKKEYKTAKEMAEKAVELSIEHLGKELKYAAAIANLSLFVDNKQSILLQQESVEIERKWGKDNESLVFALEGLGQAFQGTGDHNTAIDYFKNAIEVMKKDSIYNVHSQCRILRQIAECYEAKNKHKKALSVLKECIELLDELSDNNFFQQTRWYVYCDIARVYMFFKETEKAEKYIHLAIDLQKKVEKHEAYTSWLILGDIYFSKNDFKQAMVYYERADEDAKKEYELYNTHEALSRPLSAKAEVFRKTQKYEEALENYRKALEFVTIDFKSENFYENPLHDQFVNQLEGLEILDKKANTLVDYYRKNGVRKNLKAALDSWLLASDIVQDIRLQYLADGSKHTLIEKVHSLYENAIETTLILYDLSKEESYLEQALMFAEKNKAVLLYESVKNRSARDIANVPPDLLKIGNDLRTERAQYKNLLLSEKQKKISGDNDLIRSWERKIFDLGESYQEHIRMIEATYPMYEYLKNQIEPATLTTLREKLPNESTVIIEFMVGTKNSYVFCLGKEKISVLPIPSQEKLAKEVRIINDIISVPPQNNELYKSDLVKFYKYSYSLFSKLLEKSLNDLSDEINHLIIIPDDVLNYLPFEILTFIEPDIKSKSFSYKSLPYLFKKYEISYNYSASLMKGKISLKPQNLKKESFIGFAPSFVTNEISTSRSCIEDKLYGLYCNKDEVNNIGNLFGGSVYIGKEASLDVFKKEAPKYQIVHLATHACINDDENELNKIFFSENESMAQGVLDNFELNTQLTVLSACNTGNGNFLKGEGVMSLARSFMLAGSESVLTSLWSIDDCATSDIMVGYYKNLVEGSRKSKSIRQAKLTYLEQADANNSHPYYWAAFLQIGNTSSLVPQESKVNIYVVVVALAVALLFFLFIKRKKRTNKIEIGIK